MQIGAAARGVSNDRRSDAMRGIDDRAAQRNRGPQMNNLIIHVGVGPRRDAKPERIRRVIIWNWANDVIIIQS